MAAKRSHKARVAPHPRAQIRCAHHPGHPPRTGDGKGMAFTPPAFKRMGHHPYSPPPKKIAKQRVQSKQDARQRMVRGAPDELGRCPHSTNIGSVPDSIRTESTVPADAPTLRPKSITLLRLVQKHPRLLANRRCGHHRCHIGGRPKSAPKNLARADWLCHLFGCRTLTQMRASRENGTQASS